MLAAIGAGAAAKGEDLAIGIDQHGGIEARISRRHVPGDCAATLASGGDGTAAWIDEVVANGLAERIGVCGCNARHLIAG